MAVGEQSRQRLTDQLTLADDHATDLAFDRPGAFGERLGREAWRLVGRDGFHMASGSGSSTGVDAPQFDGSSELKYSRT